MSLEEWLRSWVYLRSSGLAARTVECYLHLIDAHLPPLHSVQLAELTAAQVSALLARICAVGHSRTAQLVYVLLRAALADAVRQGALARSPMDLVMRPRHFPAERSYLGAEDLRAFIAWCSSAPSAWSLAWLLAAVLGLRRGELCGLRWSDVDLHAQVIHIRQQRLRLADGSIQDAAPKSRSGVRDLPIPEELLPIFHQQRQRQLVRKLSGAQNGAYVITNEKNQPVSPSSLNHALKRDLKAAGVPLVPLHGLRHSMATMAMQSGVNLRVLQALLGHASVNTTAAIYCHVMMADKVSAVAELTHLCYTG